MSQTVIGIFENENEAQQAVQNLVSQGFNREDVDVASSSSSQSTGSTSSDNDDDSFGTSISNFFGSLFGSDDDRTSSYSEVAKRGVTVTVHARSESEAERAADVLDENGAVDIDEKASQYRGGQSYGSDNSSDSAFPGISQSNTSGSDYNPNDISETRSESDYNRNDINERSIPIIEENLNVGKREVESGGARLRSRIVEKPVEESVRLRSEHVNIERNPVNRQATDSDFNSFEEGTIEMREHKEVPVVGKEAWVKEEVSLNKEVEETEETIRDTVRSTEVDVENLTDEQRLSNSTSYSNQTNNNLDDDDSLLDNDRNRNI
ncbi:MAG TPA: YsnF/AvaK domain-containing protein [Pedobacter sp.]|jgi:uncharacterized protein (TIGR02271 family)